MNKCSIAVRFGESMTADESQLTVNRQLQKEKKACLSVTMNSGSLRYHCVNDTFKTPCHSIYSLCSLRLIMKARKKETFIQLACFV